MNINSKAFAKPKMTKRERKLAKGPNAMAKASIKAGQKFGGYVGSPPVYADGEFQFRKMRSGIPFVRPANFGLSAA